MTVSLGSGGVITITGTESSLANMNTGAALATGCTLISYGAAPATVRRLALLSAARILLQGTLAWNPENEEFFVSSDVPAGSGSLSDGGGGAFEVQNNGFLDIGGEATGPGAETGTDDGITYTKGTAISCAELGTGSYAATDIRNAMIYARPGSRVRIRGCTLVSESPSRFDGASGPFAACNLEIRDVVWVNGRKQTTNFFAPRIYTDNYTIRNLTMIGGTLQIQARGASASIDGIRPERMAGGIAVPGNNFGTDTDFYTLRGFDGKHNSTQDASVFNAQKLRIRNSRTGSDVNVDLQSLGHTGRSYGCIEVDQEVRFVCRDVAGNPIQGVRFHYNDFIDGRFSDAMPTNPDNWLAKNTFGSPPLGGQPSAAVIYNVQKSGSRVSNNLGICEFVGDDAVLLASKVYNDRPGSGNPVQPNPLVAKPFKYRGLNNNNTDIMPFYGDSYRHLQAALNVECKSDTVLETSVTYVDDPSVTQTDMLLVAAYLGIAINHVTDTITITTLRLLDALYDYLKWEKTQAGSEVHPTRATMVANADGTILDLGAYNLCGRHERRPAGRLEVPVDPDDRHRFDRRLRSDQGQDRDRLRGRQRQVHPAQTRGNRHRGSVGLRRRHHAELGGAGPYRVRDPNTRPADEHGGDNGEAQRVRLPPLYHQRGGRGRTRHRTAAQPQRGHQRRHERAGPRLPRTPHEQLQRQRLL